MNNLDNLLKSINEENEKVQEEINKKTSEENPNYMEYEIEKIEEVCHFKELFNIIKDSDFEILSYKKRKNSQEDDWFNETIDKYTCRFNNWVFNINGMSDVDIGEGIFGVYKATNEISGEVFEMYCDLGNRNTISGKSEAFKKLLTFNCIDDFVKEYFSRYIDLLSYLKSTEFIIDDNEFSFKDFFKEKSSSVKIKNNSDFLYLSFYWSWYRGISIAISNREKWSINNWSTLYSYDIVDYINLSENFSNQEVKARIDSMFEVVEGKIGFNYNGKYFNNHDLYLFFERLNKKVPHEAYNHYHIKFEVPNFMDRDDSEDDFYINKFEGKEICSLLEVSFNDAAQWSVGKIAFKLVFEIIYDINIDASNILLNVYGYQFNNETYEVEFESEEAEQKYEDCDNYYLEYKYVKKDLLENYKFNNPNDLLNKINEYLNQVAKSFNIESSFGSKNLW